jgi:tetratricopeptide (TPR) repeat protein
MPEEQQPFYLPEPPPEDWSGAEAYREASAKLHAGDLEGALEPLMQAVGPEEEWGGKEGPFVAAAAMAFGRALEELGRYQIAVTVYDRNLEIFSGDSDLLQENAWLRDALDEIQAKRDLILEKHLSGERGPYYLVCWEPDQEWMPFYNDDPSGEHGSWEVGDVIPVAYGGHDNWRITRIDPPPDGSSDILGCVYIVPTADD